MPATIFTESFETDGNGTRYTTSVPEFTDGSADFFLRTDGSDITGTYDVLNPDGSFYFAVQDIDGEVPSATQTLSFSGIDIANVTNLSFSALFAEDTASDGSEDWDLTDNVTVQYQIDGGGFVNLLAFESIPNGTSFNAVPAQDTDFDGDGDGAELTDTFATFGSAIAGTGSTLDLEFTFTLNAGDEDIAVDNIQIMGDMAPTGPTVVLDEPFADDSQFTVTQGSFFTDGFGDYFTLTDGSNIGSFVEFNGFDGQFLAAQDLDGEGGPTTVQTTWSNLDIAGLSNLSFSGLFAEDDSSDGNEDWDANSSVLLEYSIDGGAFQSLLAFEAAGGTNTEPLEDTDFDGIGDGTALTPDAQTFSKAIAGSGSSLDLRLTISGLDAGDEDIAVDSFVITGDAGGPSGTTLAIAPDNAVQAEGDAGTTDFTFTVTRSGDTSGATSVDFAVTGDADAADFGGTLPTGTVNFAAGETTQTVTVSVSGDTDSESDETFTVTLSNPTGGANITTATADGTIQNDDGVPVTLISEIQGSGTASQLVDQTVTVEAVVVGDFQDGDADTGRNLRGFYLQEEDADSDGNASTSEGIFVFEGGDTTTDVNIGDRVRVTGTVAEFFGETQLSNVSVTVLDNTDNSNLVTPATVTFPVASTTTNSDGELIADLEAYEGMLVTIPQELTVSDLFTLGRFGDMGLHADGRLETFTQGNAPSVSGFQAYQDLAVRNTVVLDDGRTIQNPTEIPFEIASAPGDQPGQLDANDQLRSGDTLTDLTGVVRFGRGSGGSGDQLYRINATEDPVFVNSNPRPSQAPDVGGDITVASFNVLNFFTSLDDERARNNNPLNAGPNNLEPRGANDLTGASSSVARSTQAQNDPMAEFNRQVDKLVAALSETQADIFSLIELENEFGDQNGDGEFAINFLVNQLNTEIAGANYQFVDPGQGFIDTGDAISVGLIYNANTVGIAAGTTVETLTDSGLADLGLNFGNPVFDGSGTSRAPLAATFEELATGETFTVAVNHFKSKGSISPFGNNTGIGDGVGNNNEARLQAAIAVDAWLDTDPTGSGDDDFLIVGDLNAYGMEDPIQFLINEGYSDQVKRFLESGDFEYSFGFPVDLDTSPQVQAFGALDYALATDSLASQITGAAEWHINADESVIFDYNLEFKPQEQADGLFDATPFRSSDHDPVIIGLDLASTPTVEPVLWFSSDRDNKLTKAEDIVRYDSNGDFTTIFDGSDVGLHKNNINAFDIISDTEILISFNQFTVLSDIGVVDSSDVVKFTATSLGDTTAGSFELYVDGGDLGLQRGGENIDALTRLSDGSLLFSTTGNAKLDGGLRTKDEDLIRFNPTSLGEVTDGSLELYLDGSDIQLTKGGEDINAVGVFQDQLLLSTTSRFDVGTVSGNNEDVFSFTPTSTGSTTAGTFDSDLFFDGSAAGFRDNISAVDLSIG